PAVVAALVGGLGLRRPLRQVAPLLAAVAGVPVVVAGVPRPDVPDGRERAAPGRRAHLDRVVAAAPRREGPPGRERHEVVPLADLVPVRRGAPDETLAGGEHAVGEGFVPLVGLGPAGRRRPGGEGRPPDGTSGLRAAGADQPSQTLVTRARTQLCR